MSEIWKRVPGYDRYKVSNKGRVIGASGRLLNPFDRQKHTNRNGYLTVHLSTPNGKSKYKNMTVHYLVLLAFIGERPKGFVINHINGIRGDNRLENLEYCTQSHNTKHAFNIGRHSLVGERNTQSKLTEKDVEVIVKMYKTKKYTYRKIAKLYNVSCSCVSGILNGFYWNHVTKIKK